MKAFPEYPKTKFVTFFNKKMGFCKHCSSVYELHLSRGYLELLGPIVVAVVVVER